MMPSPKKSASINKHTQSRVLGRRNGKVRLSAVLIAVAAVVAMFMTSARAAEDKDLFAEVAAYEFGGSRAAIIKLERMVGQSSDNPQKTDRIAKRLGKLLESPKTTDASKHFICRQLSLIGGAAQVPTLAKMLGEEKLSHKARYALQRMPGPAVDAALRKALATTEGDVLHGVINTIGVRGDAKATDTLIELLSDKNETVATAAATALGKIGGARAAEAISEARGEADGEFKRVLTHAWLLSAEGLLDDGDEAAATAIYKKLYAADEPAHVRVAALRGLIDTIPAADATKMLVGLMESGEAEMKPIAVGFLTKLPGAGVTKAIVDLLPKAEASVQRAMIDALAARGDASATPELARLARNSKVAAVRLAAVAALGAVGDTGTVKELAVIAGASEGKLRDAARNSLTRLRGDGVDAEILAALKGASETERIELIRSLRTRRAKAVVEQIIAAANDPSSAVRRECYAAVADLAGGEHLGRVVELMIAEKNTRARDAAEKAVVTVARRVENDAKRLRPLLSAHAKASGVARASTLAVLAELGGARALSAVRRDLDHAEAVVYDAAVRALSAWPDASPADDLAELAEAARKPVQRAIALRGFVRMVALPGAFTNAEAVDAYRRALKLATSPAEKKLVLSGLSRLADPEALKLAQTCAEDAAVKAEADQAVKAIQKAIAGPPRCSASHNKDMVQLAVDGDIKTRWKSGISQREGIWFQLDLKKEKTVKGIVLDSTGRSEDYPRAYEVYISNDAKKFGKPVTTGNGEGTIVRISFKPTRGRYVRIVSTGKAANYWSIYELKLDTK